MEIQRIYNKMQTTGYNEEQEGIVARKHLKQPEQLWGNKILGQMKPRLTCTRMMGRVRRGAEDKLLQHTT